jgi:hypothetical protein
MVTVSWSTAVLSLNRGYKIGLFAMSFRHERDLAYGLTKSALDPERTLALRVVETPLNVEKSVVATLRAPLIVEPRVS